ncbi:MAG: NAD(P)/FAD-dependent oxidoreductase [Bacilli bacterium]|nr:NAD(P)/FAD-dependent oxidoreductase [Bacilli bacterium]
MKKKKVIIIGAGPAGLTAGYQLLKESNEYDVTVIEASSDIGGISKTVKYKDYRMDIGGHRFFSKSDEVMTFWNEIMPVEGEIPYDYKETGRTTKIMEGGPKPDQEDNVMLIRNRISRIFYLNHFFDYPISLKWQTFKNMGLFRTISSVFSYIKSRIFKKKEDSLENFYINRFGKKLYSMFFENYTEKLWGRHPKEISADWGSQRVKGLSITTILKNMLMKIFHIKKKNVETSLIEEYYYPKYGPGHFWETVAKKTEEMGGKIIMKTPITNIKFKDNKIVSVSSKDQVFTADYYISSMPIKDLINGMSGNKEISSDIKRIANGLPYRDFITIGCLIPKLKIKNETKIKTLGNIVPDCWIYVQDTRVKLLRLQIFNNWSPYLLKNPKKEVWIGAEYTCQEGDKLWNMSAKEFSEFALEELETIGIIDKKSVKDYHVEKIKKAYPSYFDTYYEIDKVINYLNQFDNLYCIGRNGQHRYNNMDHSMMTAFETVRNIRNNVKKKDNIWEVNTEKEYHEEKSK